MRSKVRYRDEHITFRKRGLAGENFCEVDGILEITIFLFILFLKLFFLEDLCPLNVLNYCGKKSTLLGSAVSLEGTPLLKISRVS